MTPPKLDLANNMVYINRPNYFVITFSSVFLKISNIFEGPEKSDKVSSGYIFNPSAALAIIRGVLYWYQNFDFIKAPGIIYRI